MIEGHDIVCFANDWDGDPLSKKHVMTRLARRNRVLWVNSVGVRNPTASVRDARRVWKKLRDALRGCRRVQPNIWVLSPLVIPFHGIALARWANRHLLTLQLRRACRGLGFSDPLVWSFVPSAGDAFAGLDEKLVVYQCVDEYSEFSGTSKQAILDMERRLVERSDLVLVSSQRLLDAKRPFNPDTHLVTHGVEVEHFRRALDEDTEVPKQIRLLQRPVIGFFGLIADWIDLELIRHLATRRPHWSFVMVGKVDTDVAALGGLANVHFTGQQPYDDLPGFCRGFDVATVPFVINELTVAANPLKIREYLAAGLPVVSTALPEARRLGDLVRVADDRDDFLRHLDELVAGEHAGPQPERSAAMDAETWDRKVEQMCALLPAARISAPAAGAGPMGDASPATASRGTAMLPLGVLLAVLALLPRTTAPALPTGANGLTSATLHSTVKVRPGDAVEGAPAAHLTAARNEFESFQIVLTAARQAVRDVDIELSDMVAEDGQRIAARHLTAYRVGYVDIGSPSEETSETGEWPDPLVPRVDRYHGERRNAFPLLVTPGRNEVVWIELYVPLDAGAGVYRGKVSITVGAQPALEVPLTVRVWPFALPSTASLPTSFGFSGATALNKHDGDLLEISRLYARAALLHRISLHGGTFRPPDINRVLGRMSLGWDEYDAEMGPLLEGTALAPDDPLPGARVTSVDLRTPPALTDPEEKVAYWRAWAEHFRDNGWLDRLFFYLMDEPDGAEDYARIRETGELLRRADPELRTLVTEHVVPGLIEVVDIWVPLINCFEDKPDHSPWCDGEGVARGPGVETVWFYQSCASHGCNIVGGDYFEGWPSYVIDAPAAANRAMQWLAWRYDVDGELYYNTVEAYARDPDPWRDIRLHGGNGEGTLFYPGTPDKIGGHSEIPIESMRLKLIRDGLEDYEYLRLLARHPGREAFLDRLVRGVVPAAFRVPRDADALLEARELIGERLARLADTENATLGGSR